MSRKNLAAALGVGTLTCVALALVPRSSRADDESAILGEVTITDIAATAAGAGEKTILTFAVENGGTDPVRITGVRLRSGEPSRVMGSFGGVLVGELGGLSVGPGDIEHFDGKTAWIEVGPLAEPLVAGRTLPARLLFGSYEASVTLRVSPEERREDHTAAAIPNASMQSAVAGSRASGC
jgi:hypothetical protein